MAIIKNKLPIQDTLDFAQRNFIYRRETGEFFHLSPHSKNRMEYGSLAGNKHPRIGRHMLYILKTLVIRGRLVWLIETGEWPTSYLRHRNGDTMDDCFENLYLSAQPLATTEKTQDTGAFADLSGIAYMPRRGVFYVEALRSYYPDLKTAQRALERAS